MVLSSLYLSVSPQFHQSLLHHWPLDLHSAVSEIGTTSFTLWTKVLDKDRTCFAEAKHHLVSMDMKTKKATELPTEFHARRGDYARKLGKPGKFPAFQHPDLDTADHVTKMTHVVRHSDMDYIFHTNSASYLRFCQDCASAAAEKGQMRQFNKDMCFYLIQEVTTLHKGESCPGDELIVYAWEDPLIKMAVNFVIKKNGKEIYYARFKYYKESQMLTSHL